MSDLTLLQSIAFVCIVLGAGAAIAVLFLRMADKLFPVPELRQRRRRGASRRVQDNDTLDDHEPNRNLIGAQSAYGTYVGGMPFVPGSPDDL